MYIGGSAFDIFFICCIFDINLLILFSWFVFEFVAIHFVVAVVVVVVLICNISFS